MNKSDNETKTIWSIIKKETVKKKTITQNNWTGETFNNYFSSVAQQMSGNIAGKKVETCVYEL